MNLSGDPWVPVVFSDGQSRLVSLADAFEQGEEILDLVVTPPQRVALTRLLVCIAQTALDGPEDEQDWQGCGADIVPAALAYLSKHKECFELYGEGGFLQVPNLTPSPSATLDRLGFGLAAGNNATLFDHAATPDGRPQSPSWSALALLTFQCFSPTGTIGSTTWRDVPTSRSSEHAPCLEGSMLHTIVRGKSLLATIHLNLLTKDLIRNAPNLTWGNPVWERMPQGPDDPLIAQTTTTYLGRLAPIPRAVKLDSEGTKVTLANGCSYPKLPHREPAATVIRRGRDEELAYLGVDLSKHPWRELGSLLAFSHSSLDGGAWILGHLGGSEGEVDLWTGGLAAKQGKVLDVAEWTFHLPLALVGEIELHKYREGVELANRASGSLQAAITAYFEDLAVSEFKRNDRRSLDQRRRILGKAGASFWRSLDSRYGVLVEAAVEPARPLDAEWYGAVRAAMTRAYESSCPHQSARQLRAYAKGDSKLKLRRLNQTGADEPVSAEATRKEA
jgi:CRISPR system Cascade subunit CasA